mmetsp:Transcript_107260/g.300346  ORF Transcript_107260/g.300346 Transcript_107260/m.300346 type:complete len:265 (+) Transcript_107260:107-901(+)
MEGQDQRAATPIQVLGDALEAAAEAQAAEAQPAEPPAPAEPEAAEGSPAMRYVSAAKEVVAEAVTTIREQGVKAWATTTAEVAGQTARDSAGQARVVVGGVVERTKAKAAEVATSAKEFASDRSVQTTAAAATGGAVALGTAGGATGLATGATVGAAVGLLPAIFTFGLSIPIGAVIGGGAGLVTGATAGSFVGAVGGGAAGYGAYAKREQISEAAGHTLAKVSDSAEFVKGRASTSVDFVREKAAVVRARLLGGGTGSTEDRQ